MFNELKNFIKDDDYKIVILDNKINVVNYKNIITINDKLISLEFINKIVSIKGNNLTLVRLLEEELLITGNIKHIDMENINA